MNIRLYLSIGLICVSTLLGCSNIANYEELISDIPSSLKTNNNVIQEIGANIELTQEMSLVQSSEEEGNQYFLFLDTTMKYENGAKFLSLTKYYTSTKSLKKSWTDIKMNRFPDKSFKKHSEGMTSFLQKQSYYEHSSHQVNGYRAESINFVMRADSSSVFIISLEVNSEVDNYPDNIKSLLYCAKTLDF